MPDFLLSSDTPTAAPATVTARPAIADHAPGNCHPPAPDSDSDAGTPYSHGNSYAYAGAHSDLHPSPSNEYTGSNSAHSDCATDLHAAGG